MQRGWNANPEVWDSCWQNYEIENRDLLLKSSMMIWKDAEELEIRVKKACLQVWVSTCKKCQQFHRMILRELITFWSVAITVETG